MSRRGGFTLIELLVVISIIAVLMAIMIPTLGRIKKQAAGSACLSNGRQLVFAWILYAQDNDNKLIDGHALQHQWKQKSTLQMTDVPYPDAIRWPAPDGLDDLEFMREGFNPAR